MSMTTPMPDDEGTVIFEWSAGGPFPPLQLMPFAELNSGSFVVRGWFDTSGSAIFEIHGTKNRIIWVRSVPLQLPTPPLARFALGWKFPDDVSLFANGEEVKAGLHNQPPIQLTIPDTFHQQDFQSESEAKRQERKSYAASLRPSSGRRLRELDEEVDFLKEAIAQLDDLLALATSGKFYHARGCASLLRALIVRGRGNSFKPLLQRVAGRLDLPLDVYASPEAFRGAPGEVAPVTGLNLELRAAPAFGLSKLDLDVWLELEVQVHETLRLSNNDLLRTIADTAAAHYDPDADPMYDLLEGCKVFSGGTAVPLTLGYPVRIAEAMVEIARGVIARHHS
jgi:hypothetical protein